MFIAPSEVQEKKLKRRMRGYSRGEVEKLLQEVVASYEQVWRERDDLSRRVEQLETELLPLRGAERHLSHSLIAAERAAAEIRAKAEWEAEKLLEEARAKGKDQEAGAKAHNARLRNEIERLELVERELHASLRALLLAGLELVEDRETSHPTPIADLPTSTRKIPDPASLE